VSISFLYPFIMKSLLTLLDLIIMQFLRPHVSEAKPCFLKENATFTNAIINFKTSIHIQNGKV